MAYLLACIAPCHPWTGSFCWTFTSRSCPSLAMSNELWHCPVSLFRGTFWNQHIYFFNQHYFMLFFSKQIASSAYLLQYLLVIVCFAYKLFSVIYFQVHLILKELVRKSIAATEVGNAFLSWYNITLSERPQKFSK